MTMRLKKTCQSCSNDFFTSYQNRIRCDDCCLKLNLIERQKDKERRRQRRVIPEPKPKKPKRQRLPPRTMEIAKAILRNLKVEIGCQSCGYDNHYQTLAFHHAGTKDGPIRTSRFLDHDTEIVSELADCSILCHNCHTELHHGYRNCTNTIGIEKATDVTNRIRTLAGLHTRLSPRTDKVAFTRQFTGNPDGW